MIIIITGSRSITDYATVRDGIEAALAELRYTTEDVEELVSGGARGVDSLAERWAAIHQIPVHRFDPDWERYKRSAGIVRNKEMARYGMDNQSHTVVVALWDGKSAGTKHMMDYCRIGGLLVLEPLMERHTL